MTPLTDDDFRDAFVNASRREARDAVLPDLTGIDWERTEVVGGTDPKRPGLAYVAVDTADGPRAIILRPAATSGTRKKLLCSWCEDVTTTDNVIMWIAKRGGAAGRKGDTVGTAICVDFSCSRNARRAPSITEVGQATPEEIEYLVGLRVEGLRERSRRFVDHVVHD